MHIHPQKMMAGRKSSKPETWSFTVDTRLFDSNGTNKKSAIPFSLYEQPGVKLEVEWGDGKKSTLTSSSYSEFANVSSKHHYADVMASIHEYATAGTYKIKITSSQFNKAYFDSQAITTNSTQTTATATQYDKLNIYYFRNTLTAINEPLPSLKGVQTEERTVDSSSGSGVRNWIYYYRKRKEDNIFVDAFYGCRHLKSIPANLFSNAVFKKYTTFSGCFYYCTSLTSIPENLFKNCTEMYSIGYSALRCGYWGNLGLQDLMPFDGVGFSHGVFQGCSGLTAIPAGLFAYNTKLSNAAYAFSGCTGVTSIPANLFSKCPNLLACYYTFEKTSITTVPAALFSGKSKMEHLTG